METIAYAILQGGWEQRLADDCRRRLPDETCGVLFGRVRAPALTIEGYAVIRNVSPRPSSAFCFDPRDWVEVYYEAQKSQRTIVGFFHSHPDGTTLPSLADKDGHPRAGTYWIVGMNEEGHRLAGYRADAAGNWVPLKILPETGPSS